jgi:hypothetical protein
MFHIFKEISDDLNLEDCAVNDSVLLLHIETNVHE